MELIVFMVFGVIYLYLVNEIHHQANSYDGLKISFVLVGLQIVAMMGKIQRSEPFDIDFLLADSTMILGSIGYGIGYNIWFLIAIVIAYVKYRKEAKNEEK